MPTSVISGSSQAPSTLLGHNKVEPLLTFILSGVSEAYAPNLKNASLWKERVGEEAAPRMKTNQMHVKTIF